MDESNNVSPDTRSNEDLDKLADQTEVARNTERPMNKETEKTPSSPQKAKEDEYEFIHNGKPVRGNREQILKWAQMGYDRPQFAQKLNQEKAQWEQQKAEFQKLQEKYSPYTQIDEWASKNPTQWQKLEALWKQGLADPNALSQNQPQSTQVSSEIAPYLSKIQLLEQELSQIKPHIQEFTQWRQQTTQKEEDQKLEQEIQSIRQQHKDLDWNNPDENGKSLEMRVLEHSQKEGIKSFKTAFRDLLHDDLLNRAQAKAQQSVAKAVQTRTKLGILGETPMPSKGRESIKRDIRNVSYNDIEQEIFEDLKRGAV